MQPKYERLAQEVGPEIAARWPSMTTDEKCAELAEALANRQQLPKQCVRCGQPLRGLERSRLGLWNGEYGALCDSCDLNFITGGRNMSGAGAVTDDDRTRILIEETRKLTQPDLVTVWCAALAALNEEHLGEALEQTSDDDLGTLVGMGIQEQRARETEADNQRMIDQGR